MSVAFVRAMVPLMVPPVEVAELAMVTVLLAPMEATFNPLVMLVTPALSRRVVLAPTVKLEELFVQNRSVVLVAPAMKETLPLTLNDVLPL